MFASRTDPGPGAGSELIDVSAEDRTWDPETERIPRWLYVEGAGNVKFTGSDGVVDTWAVAAKSVINVSVIKVFTTGTTSTGIHVVY